MTLSSFWILSATCQSRTFWHWTSQGEMRNASGIPYLSMQILLEEMFKMDAISNGRPDSFMEQAAATDRTIEVGNAGNAIGRCNSYDHGQSKRSSMSIGPSLLPFGTFGDGTGLDQRMFIFSSLQQRHQQQQQQIRWWRQQQKQQQEQHERYLHHMAAVVNPELAPVPSWHFQETFRVDQMRPNLEPSTANIPISNATVVNSFASIGGPAPVLTAVPQSASLRTQRALTTGREVWFLMWKMGFRWRRPTGCRLRRLWSKRRTRDWTINCPGAKRCAVTTWPKMPVTRRRKGAG